MLSFNNKLIRINGGLVRYIEPPPDPDPYSNITAGWTTITTGASRPSFDPALGTSKTIYMKTTQIDGDYVSSYKANDAFGSDQLPLYAPSAGIWNNEWTNYTDYSNYTNFSTNFSYKDMQNTIGIATIDFFDRTNLNNNNSPFNELYPYIQTIPSSHKHLYHYDSLTSVIKLFNGCNAITGKIEPFITAVNYIKPEIEHTKCFYGCTAAQDYQHCLTAYPDWF